MKQFLICLALIVFGLPVLAQDTYDEYQKKRDSLILSQKNKNVSEKKTNTYMVEYDFSKGIYYKNVLKGKVGVPMSYQIYNINRLAYDVSISVKDSVLSQSSVGEDLIEFINKVSAKKTESEQPIDEELESNLEKNPLSEIKGEPKLEGNNNEKEKIDLITQSENLSREIGKLTAMIKSTEFEFTIARDSLQKVALNDLKEKLAKKQDSLNEKMKKFKEIIKDSNDKKDQILKQYLEENNRIVQTFSELRTSYETIITIKEYTNNLVAVAGNPFLTHKSFMEEYLPKLKEQLSGQPNYEKEYRHFKSVYSKFMQDYTGMTQFKEGFDDILNGEGIYMAVIRLESFKRLAKSMHTTVENLNIEDLQKNLKQIFTLLNKVETYEYISAPVQPKHDALVFEVDIKKRIDNDYKIDNHKKMKHYEFIRDGVRLDVSVGVGVSFHSKKYSLMTEFNNDSVNVISRRNRDIISPSFIGFFNVSKRSASHFTYGLSLGVGITAEEGSVSLDNFFVGPSFVVGRFERVLLTAGVSFRNLPQLNESYEVGDEIPNAFTLENVSKTTYRPGLFVAVSYNLTKGVRDNIKRINESL